MIAPIAHAEAGQYLGLTASRVSSMLPVPRDAMRAVVASLWAFAVTIEDGNITDVDKALRAAQTRGRRARRQRRGDQEAHENLCAALDNFIRQLAEQQRNNPQQLARPLDPNTRMLTSRTSRT
jgi:hypothetical protein